MSVYYHDRANMKVLKPSLSQVYPMKEVVTAELSAGKLYVARGL